MFSTPIPSSLIPANHSGNSKPETRAIAYAIDRDQCYVEGLDCPVTLPSEIIQRNPELLNYLRTQSLGYEFVMLLPLTSRQSAPYICKEFSAFKDICKDAKAAPDSTQAPRLKLPNLMDLLSNALKDIYVDDYSKTLIILGHLKLITEALEKPENEHLITLDFIAIDDKKEKLRAMHKALNLLKQVIPHQITLFFRQHIHGSGMPPIAIDGVDCIKGEAQHPIHYEHLIKKLKAEYSAVSGTRKFIRAQNSFPLYRRPAQSIDLSLSISTAHDIRQENPHFTTSQNFANWIQEAYLNLEAKKELDFVKTELENVPYFNFFLPSCYITRTPSTMKEITKIYNKVTESKETPQKAINEIEKLLKSGSQPSFFRDETTRSLYENIYSQFTIEKINPPSNPSLNPESKESEKTPFLKQNMN